jgi:hypothetical protein
MCHWKAERNLSKENVETEDVRGDEGNAISRIRRFPKLLDTETIDLDSVTVNELEKRVPGSGKRVLRTVHQVTYYLLMNTRYFKAFLYFFCFHLYLYLEWIKNFHT